MKKLNKHWPAIQLSIVHWWIFATLSLIATVWFLRMEIKDRDMQITEMSQELQTMRHNFEEIEKQYPNSEVILKLNKGGQ